jgi:hypothetical protein
MLQTNCGTTTGSTLRILVAAALASLVLGGPVHADTTPPQPPEKAKVEAPPDTDLTGKVVFVETANNAATLEQVRVRQLGDRFFVVGRVINDGNLTRGTFTGTTMWLPLAEVKRLVVSDNLKKLGESLKPEPGR